MHIFSPQALDFRTQGKNLRKLENVTLCGFFVALYIVVYSFNIIITPMVQIRLGYFVLAAAGLYGGPLFGMLVGIISDLMSMITTGGQGASYFFGFTVSYALMGFFFGLIFYRSKLTMIRGFMGAFFEFLVSIFINTYWLCLMSGTPYLASFYTRLPKSLIMLVVSTVLFYIVLSVLNRVFQMVSNYYHR